MSAPGGGPAQDIIRQRLVDRLNLAVLGPVTAVTARVGSGKSVLVDQWAASRRDLCVVVVRLAADDDRPSVTRRAIGAVVASGAPLGADAARRLHAAGHGLAVPTRPVMLIGALCFLVMLAEGAIAEWGGIYLRHDTGATPAAAATAFAAFSFGMAAARLGGDLVNARIGAVRLLRVGTALVAVALGGVLVVGETIPAVVGFALCGLGIANAVPLLFSAAGRIQPPGPSLAAAFTLGYTGFIVGPPVIGVLSDQNGLPATLALLVPALLIVTVLGRRAITGSHGSSSVDSPVVVGETAS